MLYGLHKVYKDDHERGVKSPEPQQELVQEQPMQIDSTTGKPQASGAERIPFVWIHDVAAGSPAEQDGFLIGDAIY